MDGSAGPGDVSDHPICISDVFSHSGDPDQVLSEDDFGFSVWVKRMLWRLLSTCSGGTVYGRDGIMAFSHTHHSLLAKMSR